jgi:hypothetical protein
MPDKTKTQKQPVAKPEVKPAPSKHNIIFCLPGNQFSGRFLDSFSNLIVYCVVKGITFCIARCEDSVVHFVRNKCLGGNVMRGTKQLPYDGKRDYTHTMWIDSDMVFSTSHFDALLEHSDLDIVSGVYSLADGQHFAAVEKWDIDYFKKYGCFQFMPIDYFKDRKGLVEVSHSGFGFTLVKKGVFEKVGYPWFRPVSHTIENMFDYSSEDVSFCLLAREKGYKIFVDPQIRIGHEKKVVL